MKVTLEKLGIIASYSHPRVSNDNPFSEALFRTCKYCRGSVPPGAAFSSLWRQGKSFPDQPERVTSQQSTRRVWRSSKRAVLRP